MRSLDWKNPLLRPSVSLVLTDEENPLAGRGVIAILGKPLTAEWAGGMTAEGGGKLLRAGPLDSIDTAIQLLALFRNEDEQWKTLVEWKEVSEEE